MSQTKKISLMLQEEKNYNYKIKGRHKIHRVTHVNL